MIGAWLSLQVINGVKLRRLQLHAKLDAEILDSDSWINDDCFLNNLKESEADLNLNDSSFTDASELSVVEKSSLYYICGYIALK